LESRPNSTYLLQPNCINQSDYRGEIMKVYVVMRNGAFETTLECIFSNKKDAEDFINGDIDLFIKEELVIP